MNQKLFLVDASSMFFRAYYAVRPLSNSKGLPTNAIYGYLSMIVKLLKEMKPDYLAFCYDLPTPSFRKDLYKEYKANRTEMPEDLAPQIPYIKKVTEALGLMAFEMEGYEADDLIGTLAKKAESQGLDVVIISGDKDFSQLITEHVTMFDTMKDAHITEEKVKEKWGVLPKDFIDYLALTGDSSDNIPGVRGVGPKGAQKLIDEYHTVESIYEHIEDIKNPSLKNKLKESQTNAFLSKKLVTIHTEVPLKINIRDLKIQPRREEDLSRLLQELEFESFRKNLIGDNVNSPTTEVIKEKVVSSFKVDSYKGEKLHQWLKATKELWVIDSEKQFIFANEASSEIAICEDSDEELCQWLNSQKPFQWLGFDLKQHWRKLSLQSPQVAHWDSQLAAYVVNAEPVNSFAETYQKYVGEPVADLSTAEDHIEQHLRLREVLIAQLEKTKMRGVLDTIELPLVDVLSAMETHGICLDVPVLQRESQSLGKDIKALEEAIYKEAGETFNIASPKQLAVILFDKLKMPKGKKTKTGYSTNTDVLEALSGEYPLAEKIIQYRELSKLKSTYVDALPLLVNPKTQRIHTQFNQALTATGRLSSTHPNLQNIPIRTERGMQIRRAFVAQEGCTLISADYSQIELRILAHISGDDGLKEAFALNQDIHSRAASEIFTVPIDEVTDDLRRKAKAVNFGIAYGQGVYGLAEGLKIPRAEAKQIIETYFARFKGVKKYMEESVQFVKDHGYTETLLGRRRYIPEIHSKNFAVKAFAERAAINAPIQGMASDLVKLAMIQLADEFRSKMILQVHDELLFELSSDDQLPKSIEKIRQTMENCVELNVPLKVNIASGKNWAEI